MYVPFSVRQVLKGIFQNRVTFRATARESYFIVSALKA